MDRIALYRQAIKTFLHEYTELRQSANSSNGSSELEIVCDSDNDRYLVLDVGWEQSRRIHNCIFHLDIKDGKIWIQENNTDIEIDQELEMLGITKKDLVIGFHHPSVREYSDYSVA